MLTTASGNLTMHLNAKHNLYETDVNDSENKQAKILSVPLVLQKKLDSSICQFVVTSHVGHSFVESESFLDLIRSFSPFYAVKKAQTVKRRMFCMYVTLKLELMKYRKTD